MQLEIFYTNLIPTPDLQKKDAPEIILDLEKIKSDYSRVWSGTTDSLNIAVKDDWQTLESIFESFNKYKPDNYQGRFRSISIGDVVALENRYYVCQSLDWRQLSRRETEAFSLIKN